jgi:hypothetical protein
VDSLDDFEAGLPWPEFQQLYAYWRSKCSGGRLPARACIDPVDFAALLPRIYLVDVVRSPDRPALGFRFRLMGTEHVQINEREITGLTIEEAFGATNVAQLRLDYTAVATARKPLLTLSARPAIVDRTHVVYDRLLLPLASDGVVVDMVLGYFHRRPV